MTIDYVIEFDDKLEFYLSARNFAYKSTWANLDEFNIIPDVERLINGYMKIQNQFTIMLTKIILIETSKETNKNLHIKAIPMKTPNLISSIDENIFISIFPAILSISYISILFQFVLWLVIEKEKKLKDLLTRQGVTTIEYLLSWLFTFILFTIVPIIINSFLLKFYLFPKTNILFIFLNLFLFSLNILGMALVFHQFVNDVRSGQSLLKLVYISVSLFSVVISREGVHYIFRYIFSIFPQTVLKSSFEIFLSTSNFENGLDWNMMFAYYKGVNMCLLYTIYLIDFIIYILFAYFLQNYSQSGLGFTEFVFSSCVKRRRKIYSLKKEAKEESINPDSSFRSSLSNDKSNCSNFIFL